MNKIITFGEVLMRLSPRGNKKFIQSNLMEFYFGGTELNVGISIANFGGEVKHISSISDDFIGNTAISYINKFGLDTSGIVYSKRPLGIYFLEIGAGFGGYINYVNTLGFDCIAVDIDDHFRDSYLNAGIKFILQDANKIDITIDSNVVILSHIIEHIDNPKNLLNIKLY